MIGGAMKKATHGAKILSEIVKKLDESELTVQDLGCALRLLSGSSAFTTTSLGWKKWLRVRSELPG
jgi:hypothetical protein